MKNKTLYVLLFACALIYAQEQPSFSEISTQTQEITTQYFNDYINLDFEAMKPQMHQDISFNDTTAKLIFGVELVEGKTQVFENFKKTYASIIEMKADIIRTMFSSHVGIFEIELTYKFKEKAESVITISRMPLVIVLTVKEGKLVEHRDYGDYKYFLKQYSNQRKIN